MINIKDFTIEKLQEYIESIGEKKFHATQIFKWLYRSNVKSFDEMTDLSKSLREKLKQFCYINTFQIEKLQESKDGTKKYAFRLQDNNIIESVLMRYKHGNTVCVSCQVGCKMGCTFCASSSLGFARNLTPGEIVQQILQISEHINENISNIVFMGIGEPLDNYDNVIDSIKIINNPFGINIGARHISLSTCGVVPKIYELADYGIQCILSISLHATTDEVRKKIMPITNAYSVNNIIKACKYYLEKTNRRISFEYALISGVNDTREEALKLAKLLKGMLAHVNIIPINKIKNGLYNKGSENSIKEFVNILNDHGIVATIRRELGSDIEAACGQLRRDIIEDSKIMLK